MRLIYVPSDNIVLVNDRAIVADYIRPSAYQGQLHAVQWSENQGEYETIVDYQIKNISLTADDFNVYVKPLYDKWEELRIIEDTPPIVPEPTLEEVKLQKTEEINQVLKAKAQIVKANVVQEEIDTWDIQRLEALAWEKDPTALTPNLDLIAQGRGITRLELINKTLSKVKQYQAYFFPMLGVKQSYEDLIEQAATVAEVQAIVWE